MPNKDTYIHTWHQLIKPSNNGIFICKQWYMDQIINELHMYYNNNDGSAYRLVHDISNEELVREQASCCDLLELALMGGINDHKQLSTIYGLPNMRKTTPKLCFIAAACMSPLKPVDLALAKCLGVIYIALCRTIARVSTTECGFCIILCNYIGNLLSVTTI